jgi:hypothetical protein
MAKATCPTCHRSDGNVNPSLIKYNRVFYLFWQLLTYILLLLPSGLGTRNSKSHEVSLASIHNTAAVCKICSFIQESLACDVTTPNKDDISYESAMVRVDDEGLPGLRITGQWQGALVVEIYKPGKF